MSVEELVEKNQNRTPGDITTAEKYEFLQLIHQGLDRSEAARRLGYVGRHFRAICSPQSPFYDEDFAHDYGQAISSVEYDTNRLERLRAEAQRWALISSDRLLEKLLMVHDPDWSVLRERKTESNVNIAVLVQQQLKELPTDKLEQILSLIESGETVDAEIIELPVGRANDG